MFKIGVVEFECGHDSGGAVYGDQTIYTVEINPGSLAEANAMRWQMLGQKDQIVAVLWDDDPMVNGMYIQRDCSVSPIANYLAHGRMSVNVVLERAPDIIEASYTLTERTGGYTPSNMKISSIHGYASAALTEPTYVHDTDLFVMTDTKGLSSPDDLPYLIETGTKSFVDGTQVSVQQACDPREYNIGRCRIEVNGGDEAGWWTLTGTTVPEGHDVRVSNGRVRIQVVAGETYVLSEQWDDSVNLWQPCARYSYGMGGVTYSEFNRRFKIRRNDHACVEITCSMVWAAKTPFFVDLKIVRGFGVCWGTITNEAFGQNTPTSKVSIAEYDGSNMATALGASNTGLARSSAIGGETPYLHTESTGITLSTSTDDSSKSGSLFQLVGMGNDGDAYKTEYQVSDRLVY